MRVNSDILNPVLGKDDIVIALSQSGETADTLAAVKIARSMGAFVIRHKQCRGSSIPRVRPTCGAYIHVYPGIELPRLRRYRSGNGAHNDSQPWQLLISHGNADCR